MPWNNNEVTHNQQDVRGGGSNRTFEPGNGRIRLRQHGTFLALFTNFAHRAKFMNKRMGFFGLPEAKYAFASVTA
jgi:hypothetical protein